MKFCIENQSKSSGRVGQLKIGETGKHFKTPLLLQTTKGGSIPHLSREVFDYVTKDTQVLQLTLVTMLRMAESVSKMEGDDCLSRYIGYAHCPTLLVINDPCEPLQGGHNDKDVVPIFTRHGKEQITVKRYMELMECFSPDIYIGVCDADTNYTSSKKRIQKSFDRTERFMNDCFQLHRSSEKLKRSTLFAPIVGGYNAHVRTKAIEHINREGGADFGGYVLEGFHNYGTNAFDVNEEELYSIVSHCTEKLIADKPRMMTGAYTPTVILELIRLGIDIFDSSYPYCATKNFKALTFCFDINNKSAEDLSSFMDLTNESYKEDFRPFMSDCVCLTCKKHTRAYVHHLYKTRELLGPILLMIHNLHHYIEFFETIRECIAVDKLPELQQLIKYQNGESEINYCVQDCTAAALLDSNGDSNAASI